MNAAGIRVRQTLFEMFFEARRQRAGITWNNRQICQQWHVAVLQPLMMEGNV